MLANTPASTFVQFVPNKKCLPAWVDGLFLGFLGQILKEKELLAPGSGKSYVHAAHICQEAHSSSSLPTAAVIMRSHTAEQYHICFFTLHHKQNNIRTG